jgi:hypothetical protein
LEKDLGVRVCHELKMPLPPELENLFFVLFYKDFAPTALPEQAQPRKLSVEMNPVEQRTKAG